MTTLAPLVSVVIACYNAEKYLRASVLSVLQEKLDNMEVLVVDDASTDSSMESIQDLPVEIISIPVRKGQAVAQNMGIARARGKFLCFLDSDDVLAPGGIRGRLDYMEQNSEAPLVAGTIPGVINAQGLILGDYGTVFNRNYPTPPRRFGKEYLETGGQFYSHLWLYLFRRNLLAQVGPLDESYTCSHDNDYIHRILKLTPIDTIPCPVAYYRVHDTNLSGSFLNGKWIPSPQSLAENLFIKLLYKS